MGDRNSAHTHTHTGGTHFIPAGAHTTADYADIMLLIALNDSSFSPDSLGPFDPFDFSSSGLFFFYPRMALI